MFFGSQIPTFSVSSLAFADRTFAVHAALRQAPFKHCNTVVGNFTTRMPSFFFVLTVTAIPPPSGNGSEIICNSSPESRTVCSAPYPKRLTPAQTSAVLEISRWLVMISLFYSPEPSFPRRAFSFDWQRILR
jgi:hypothetical protein